MARLYSVKIEKSRQFVGGILYICNLKIEI